MNLKRISVTGPESTGKSWLAEKLADYYETVWVPEVARNYLLNLGRPYVYEDIAVIAREQIMLEDQMAQEAKRILFCDTDPIITKIWSYFKYHRCDPWIEKQVFGHRYNLYLLCDIDLPWENDPLREHPDKRKVLFGLYMKELNDLGVNYRLISGIGNVRLRNAISAVDEAFG